TDFDASLAGKVATAGRLDASKLLDPAFVQPAVELNVASVTVGDTTGNNNGAPEPGERITVNPTVFNHGYGPATGATVQLVNLNADVTIVGAASQTLGTINSMQSVAPGSAFQLQLGSAMTDLETVNLRFVITDGV